MNEQTLHVQISAALTRLLEQHPELGKRLREAHGFAIFPSVGRASAVLGVGYGHGEVFEGGHPIGFATISQLTVGVQIGGQTFSELLVFESPEALEDFKRGPVTFNANVSAVIVKAGASGTTDFKGVEALAFSEGGELLEASLGGQKFSFQPPSGAEKRRAGMRALEEKGAGLVGRLTSKFSRHRRAATEHEEHEQEAEESAEEAPREHDDARSHSPSH